MSSWEPRAIPGLPGLAGPVGPKHFSRTGQNFVDVMNLIMNKIKNLLIYVNVSKLMYIYINEKTLNKLRKLKRKLQFAKINLKKKKLCELKNKVLEKEI